MVHIDLNISLSTLKVNEEHKEHLQKLIILSHKARHNKFQKNEIIQTIFSNYNGLVLGINNKRVTR